LTIGFSPCPNDTFIFDALVNRKIDSGELEFEPVLEDVETLNQWAMQGKLDITKLSFPAYFRVLDNYVLLDSGSALGNGVGPLLISNTATSPDKKIEESSIAIPGKYTTANMLLSFAFPNATNKVPMIFSFIEEAVLSGITELGVIIHENRFTYAEKGLHKLLDLGEYWEEKMKLPLPLGGIAANRKIDKDIILKANSLIRKSLEYAFSRYPEISDYVKQHSRAMNETVMRRHIDLYVNDHSLSLGTEGRKSVRAMYDVYLSMQDGGTSDSSSKLFLS